MPSLSTFQKLDLYRLKYGDRIGSGSLAGLLGDPSKFDFPLRDGCRYFWPAVTHDGNFFLILAADSNQKFYYDFQNIGESASASATAFAELRTVADASRENGIDRWNGSVFSPTVDLLLPRRYDIAINNPISKTLPPRYVPGDLLSIELFILDTNAKDGYPYYCVVDPELRIGVLANTVGEHCGGSCWGVAALHTIVDIILVVVGFLAGNAGLIKGALEDDVNQWVAYTSQIHAREQAGKAAKYAPANRSVYCDAIRATNPDWADVLLGRS